MPVPPLSAIPFPLSPDHATPCCVQDTNQPAVLIDVLLVASQLARISKDGFNTYEAISRAAIYPHIRSLLMHSDPGEAVHL